MVECVECGAYTKFNGGHCLSCYSKIKPKTTEVTDIETAVVGAEAFDGFEEEKLFTDKDRPFVME